MGEGKADPNWAIVTLISTLILCTGTVIAAFLGSPVIDNIMENKPPSPSLTPSITLTKDTNVPVTATATESANYTAPTIQSTINIDTVLSNIVPGNGGIEIAAPWYKAITVAREDGTYDPTVFPGGEGCFGVAWNVLNLFHTVVVFQSAQTLDFQDGGHYSLICLTNNVALSAIDVGRIQSTWLSKEHGGTWEIQVLD